MNDVSQAQKITEGERQEYEGVMDAFESNPHQAGRGQAYDDGFAYEYERQQKAEKGYYQQKKIRPKALPEVMTPSEIPLYFQNIDET